MMPTLFQKQFQMIPLGERQNCVIQNLFLFQLCMYSKTLVNMYYISNKALNHTFECFEIA